MRIELSKRLQAVAEMVTPGMRLADIGTDHGYIPIYLVERGVIPSAIAMDINRGPLERARKHIGEMGLSDRIETRLSDGLKQMTSGEADAMIAAGMGGALIVQILSDESETAAGLKELILQPQSEISKVRAYLLDHDYQIVQEDMVFEEGKYYPMMKAVKGERENYLPEELEFGKCLLEKKHPVLRKYLEWEIAHQESILSALKEQKSPRTIRRAEEVELRIEEVKRILKERYIDEL